MKKIKLPNLFKRKAKRREKEHELMETMELLARVVDDRLYDAMADLGEASAYAKKVHNVWNQVEDEEYEKAKELLYSLAVMLDDDAAFILDHMVYPNKNGVYYFFEYFCEYLADARIIDYHFRKEKEIEEQLK
ncbi:MAG: hypothetical protein IKU44_05045 [Firmicutes bacterium]|nr:hypothetical protein [Bacillota bacterium]